MKRILLYIPHSTMQATNYVNIEHEFQLFGNSGNKIFEYALEKILKEHNVYYDCSITLSSDKINSEYDCVIMLFANMFSVNDYWVKEYCYNACKNLTIPIFVISVGIQCTQMRNMEDLINKINEPSKRFIDKVYTTGGEFGLRGEITKIFFNEVYPCNTAEIIGCPSICMNGRDLQLSYNKVLEKNFKVMLHGDARLLRNEYIINNMIKHKTYEFFDQATFFSLLFCNYKGDYERLSQQYPPLALKLIRENRMNFIYDPIMWRKYYIDNNFNFSFGSRIHGSIIALLSGVYSLVYSRDLRTKELCDFYNIPYVLEIPNKNLYDLYLEIDYTKFNQEFKYKYDILHNFLIKHGIIDKNNKTEFIDKNKYQMPIYNNRLNINPIYLSLHISIYWILWKCTFIKPIRRHYKKKYKQLKQIYCI